MVTRIARLSAVPRRMRDAIALVPITQCRPPWLCVCVCVCVCVALTAPYTSCSLLVHILRHVERVCVCVCVCLRRPHLSYALKVKFIHRQTWPHTILTALPSPIRCPVRGARIAARLRKPQQLRHIHVCHTQPLPGPLRGCVLV